IVIAVGSGLAYGGVILGLRVLLVASPCWLTVVNHLTGALVLLPFVLFCVRSTPSWTQLGVMFVFGSTQMALPYWLAARGLRAVSPQEAGAITLLAPLCIPLGAYLVSAQGAAPGPYT